MFKLYTTETKFFGNILKLLKELSPHEYYIWIDNNALKLGCIDPSHVVIAEFSLNEKCISINGELKDKMIVSDTKDFTHLLKLAKKDDVFTIEYVNDILQCTISDDEGINIYANVNFDVELNNELPKFPGMLKFYRVDVSIENFDKALKYQMQFCDEIKIIVTENFLELEGERKGKKIKSKITLKPKTDIIIKKAISSKVNTMFINAIEKTLRISDSVHLYINENYPIIFQFELKDDKGTVKYFISPILIGEDGYTKI